MGTYNEKRRVIENFGLLIIDLCCVILAYLTAMYVRYRSFERFSSENIHIITMFCILVFCLIYDSVIDSNRDFTSRGYYVELIVLLKRNAIISIVWGWCLFLFKAAQGYSRLVFGYFIIANILFTYVLHLVFKKYIRLFYAIEKRKTKVMLITDSRDAGEVIAELKRKAEYLYDIVAVTIWDCDWKGQSLDDVPVVAGADDICEVAKGMPLDEVLIYLPRESREDIQKLLMDFEMMGIVCHYSIDVVSLNVKTRVLQEFAGFTVITYALNQIDYKHRLVKRCMDLAGGIIGMLIMLILWPFVAIAIKLDSRGPVLFAQTRIGKNGRRFKIYKFRSMYTDAEERKKDLMKQNEMSGLMFKMENDPRVTKVGKFLRKTSIDELPQFINVLRGDMSLVGTRPPTEDEFEKYNPYYRRRLCMTPGLTGLWQVSGRSEIDNFDDVVKYDLQYIDYWSLSLDIKIIFKTIGVVLFGRGAK